jgi:purine-binding chemotaxis protein CheW
VTKQFDWHTIHRRLQTARGTIERGWVPTPEQRKQVLKARAATLARSVVAADPSEPPVGVVEFTLAYENYGVESTYVREVHPVSELTRLPCTPRFVAGIVNVRGEIVSVVDLKKFLELPDKGLTDLNKMIVLQSDSMMFGLLADAVNGVRDIAARDIHPPPPHLTGIRAAYLKGVAEGRMALLDGGKLLSDTRMVVHEVVNQDIAR